MNLLITGANRGIGLELARQLSQRGDRVIAVCRAPSDALEALDLRIESGIDVTDRGSLEELAGRLAGVELNGLINNAGVLRASDFDALEDQLDDYRLQYEVNALAPLRVTRALRDRLAEGARVVIITSRMGSIADNGSGGHYGYRMSKAAVNMAGVSLAHELKPRGVAVGLLHPGYVKTDMTGNTGHVGPDEAAAGLIRRFDELSLATTGSFRHANGDSLDW
ncbi:SDR family oxidoreductase [Wenzhouxiangella sp. XN79A]|uniref:SDR family oxidoreductase n=1 Tax=Wenzhouxiangella sp. XN79A TaxID=2724193 RepID=UPI00144A54B2|nr:SDR family oxidoreductase [Wenzhouxiangella sp. XN79A]NKI34078.1 SDR family oxidoreductase [Wenzhouxiangella sp. XN79A]